MAVGKSAVDTTQTAQADCFVWAHVSLLQCTVQLTSRCLPLVFMLTVHLLQVGCGADELIDLLMRCILDPGDSIVDCPPTFTMYAFDAAVNDAQVITVPRGEHFQLDVAGELMPWPAYLCWAHMASAQLSCHSLDLVHMGQTTSGAVPHDLLGKERILPKLLCHVLSHLTLLPAEGVFPSRGYCRSKALQCLPASRTHISFSCCAPPHAPTQGMVSLCCAGFAGAVL